MSEIRYPEFSVEKRYPQGMWTRYQQSAHPFTSNPIILKDGNLKSYKSVMRQVDAGLYNCTVPKKRQSVQIDLFTD